MHPEVFIPRAKDIYFFDRYYHKGLKWYESFFEEGRGKKAVGEISHDYLFSAEACDRIREAIPEAKLITCLRNPFERSFSHYLFCVRQGLTRSDFITSSTSEYPSIIDNSKYSKPLERYISTFGRDNLLILRFDDLRRDPAGFIRRIYGFIGVDPDFSPDEVMSKKVLPAGKPRVRTVAYLAKQCAVLMRHMGFANLLGSLKSSPMVQKTLYVPYGDGEKPRPTLRETAFMREHYEEEVKSLERVLGEDFRDWLPG